MAGIDRNDVVIPDEVMEGIIQAVPSQSAVLQMGRRLRDMARGQTRLAVNSELPVAGFVNGDTGLKPISKMSWEGVYINAEELACIVPVPESVLADTDYDIWEEVQPRIVEAMGAAIDAAILFGVNKPASWPDDLLTGATAASQVVQHGSDPTKDLYDEIMGEGGVLALVEEDGFAVTGHIAALNLRAKLRSLRTQDGLPIFTSSMQDINRYALDGEPIEFPRNGFDASAALLFAGDWNQLVWSMRQDISMKFATEAVLTDNAGNVVLNLFQQDSVALRVVMRLGFALPNPVNLINTNPATRYPFAVLVP